MVVFIKGLKKFDGIRSLFSGVTNTRKVMSDVASMIASLMASGIGPEQAASAAAAFYAQHAATAPKTKTKAKAKVPATEKKEKTLKVFAEGEQCLARVWQTAGEFGAQCNRAKKDGCDFCAFHQLQANVTEEPLQWDEDGRKKGLHLGRFDKPIAWQSEDGAVCYAEFAPAGAVDALKESGEFKWHPFVKQGRAENGTAAPKRERKPKADKPAKKEKKKQKRAKTAYWLFLDEHREAIKAEVLASRDDGKAPVTEVTKIAGARWNAIKETPEAAKYHDQAAALKAALADEADSSPAQVSPKVDVVEAPVAEEAEEAEGTHDLPDGVPTPKPDENGMLPDGTESAEKILKDLGVKTPPAESGDEEEGEGDAETEHVEHEGKYYILDKSNDKLYYSNDEAEFTNAEETVVEDAIECGKWNNGKPTFN